MTHTRTLEPPSSALLCCPPARPRPAASRDTRTRAQTRAATLFLAARPTSSRAAPAVPCLPLAEAWPRADPTAVPLLSMYPMPTLLCEGVPSAIVRHSHTAGTTDRRAGRPARWVLDRPRSKFGNGSGGTSPAGCQGRTVDIRGWIQIHLSFLRPIKQVAVYVQSPADDTAEKPIIALFDAASGRSAARRLCYNWSRIIDEETCTAQVRPSAAAVSQSQ